ncbi:hypothetical protein BDP81DRAFT_439164 [Colletotrichum phormii]|uniref:Uncharacterized protein n=1 Tax=Colletotrichum phormii TaxID=359342 RepID=A0AAI9ZG32_9PEZI|nr:uncharacterized protein BDP81DRAFT_439164 [Colletotrichum phormii]KAK1623602.1 hypothetical protein BDP81DRAFT_439164 [Colletotrichum phormii]
MQVQQLKRGKQRFSSLWQDKKGPTVLNVVSRFKSDRSSLCIPSRRPKSPTYPSMRTHHQRPGDRGHRGYIKTMSLSFPHFSLHPSLPPTVYLQDYIVSFFLSSSSTRPLERLPVSQLGSFRRSPRPPPMWKSEAMDQWLCVCLGLEPAWR